MEYFIKEIWSPVHFKVDFGKVLWNGLYFNITKQSIIVMFTKDNYAFALLLEGLDIYTTQEIKTRTSRSFKGSNWDILEFRGQFEIKAFIFLITFVNYPAPPSLEKSAMVPARSGIQ